MDVNR